MNPNKSIQVQSMQVQSAMRASIYQTARQTLSNTPNAESLDEGILGEFANALFQEHPRVNQEPYSKVLVEELTAKLVQNYQNFIAKLRTLPSHGDGEIRPLAQKRKFQTPPSVAAKPLSSEYANP